VDREEEHVVVEDVHLLGPPLNTGVPCRMELLVEERGERVHLRKRKKN
jgi:hypothetical protein